MAERRVDFLIIGGGVAAASCAAALRERGADGSVLVVGREADAPYDRPPLSKGYLRGSESREDATLQPSSWWQEHGVELLTRTSAMRLDPDRRVARLSTKLDLSFEQALIATGANVRRLRVEGSGLDGIHYLRAFANADAIRADAVDAEHVVTIGGSYIGCEVAASLATAGRRCTIVMQERLPLERHFGADVGRFVEALLRDHGVEIVGEDELERFEGSGDRVEVVVTKAGRTLPCEVVVIGVGVTPDVTLARSAGLALGARGGVACSAALETSVPGIFAAGDVAEYDSPLHGRPVLVEHREAAFEQGRTAARRMLGEQVTHDVVPYFWSDLADWATLEYVGIGRGDPVLRGSPDAGDFSVFFVDERRVSGALSVGRPGDLVYARQMIANAAHPPIDALADESTDLATL